MTELRDYYESLAVDRERLARHTAAFRAVVQAERDAGRTWQDIADELGLTRQRVMRIANPKTKPETTTEVQP
jgi:predicted transcriptional regulator